MNRNTVLLILAILAITSCKTNEANYRAAYEMAVQKEKEGIDEDTYALMKKEEQPRQIALHGDTLNVITRQVTVAKNAGNDTATLKRYNVAVSEFRQIFNAKAMRKRIADKGYDAFVAQTAEPSYYVVAAACDTREEATEIVKRLSADGSIILRPPYPCILEPAR